jgi:ferrous iron transport protein A
LRRNLNKARVMLMPLDMLRAGEWAEVAEVTGPVDWVGRLAELGLRAGSRVQVVQPGSPCLLAVGDSKLCLRGAESSQILVCPVHA